jgi:putative ABC transport system permease protein
MFSNYLTVAWRLLRKSKLYSSINIIGLAAGMAVAILIGIWVWDEVSFDTYHVNHARLANVLSIVSANGEITVAPFAAVPLAAELRAKYPDDFKALALVASQVHDLAAGNKKISQWGTWAQPAFPEMFTLHMLKGSRDALKDPACMLVDQTLAKSLFGDADPMNKIVKVDEQIEMKVGGVYADLPENTQFYGTSCLLAWDNRYNRGTTPDADWTDHHFQLFVQLSDGADFEKTSARIKNIAKPHLRSGYEEIRLHPMDQWHLYNEFSNGKVSGGQIRFVRLFAMIGVFVLLLACINFMNLSTARSERRAKEVGIRKTVGSSRGQLIGQFLSESLLMASLALVLALLFVMAAFPFFNELAGKHLYTPWANPMFWLTLLSFTVFTGVIAGSYPAFYLSGFEPVKVLKGPFRAGTGASTARKVLVVVQFTVSITLIIGTLIVFRQIGYARDRPVGYSREGLLTVNMTRPDSSQHYDALRNDLLQTGAVENMAESSSASTGVENSMLGYDWKGRDPHFVPIIETVFVTYDFGKTLGWQIKEGRDFSRDFPTDSGAFILNEAAVRFTGLRHPVGEVIRWHQEDHLIVGVVKDMVMESPYMPAQPTFFTLLANRRIHVISIRIKPALPVREALARIESVFRKYDPDTPFDYEFTDEAYGRKFIAEEHMGNLSSFFTLLAIFISCLGLFGLAAFVAAQRTREIGVRKVLGASVVQLWQLLSKEFVVLVMLSWIIASPIAWWALHGWLQTYAYRTSLSWWIFGAAGAGSLLVTLSVVSVQSIKAARMNPIKSLKTE